MAKQSAAEAGRAITFVRWLYWETVRHHPLYGREARELRRTLGRMVPPTDSGGRQPLPSSDVGRAALDALRAYRQLIVMARTRKTPTAYAIARYITPDNLARLPAVQAFARRWGLRFPVPAALPDTPESFIVNPIVAGVQILNDSEARLEVRVWRRVGRDSALQSIRAALAHSQPYGRSSRAPQATVTAKAEGNFQIISITSPANAPWELVEGKIRSHFPRSAYYLRPRQEAVDVFAVARAELQCARHPGESLQRLAERLYPTDPDCLAVLKTRRRRFRQLVEHFELPRLPPRFRPKPRRGGARA